MHNFAFVYIEQHLPINRPWQRIAQVILHWKLVSRWSNGYKKLGFVCEL